MDKFSWLNYVEQNKNSLLLLISRFHPTSNQGCSNLEITAATAEKMCSALRKIIKNDLNYSLGKSVAQLFEEAIINKDTNLISVILYETWVGVPESTSCWTLTGFKECVELLDDPVEEA